MIYTSRHSLVRGIALGVGFACLASTAAFAQSGNDPAPSWLDRRVTGLEQKLAFFGARDEPTTGEPNIQTVQSSMADIAVRLDRLENQMRQLNGRLEELQFQGKKNEDALKRAQEDTDFRLKDLEGGKGGGGSGASGGGGSQKPQRRGDAGDSGAGGGSSRGGGDISVGSNGGGSGAPPASLGQTRSSGGGDAIRGLIDEGGPGDDPNAPMSIRPPGAGGGRSAGGDYGGGRSGGGDYGGGRSGNDYGGGRSSGADYGGGDDSRVASREPPTSVTAGTGSPRDQFDLGVGFVQRRNYDQAEATFRDFLRSYPNDAKAPEATYWLGESLFQRKKYADAVENFLKIYNTAPNSAKAPESMLKLGMALNGMGKKEEACGTLDAAGKKYARIKPQSDREFKRLSC